jgi:hypothetical protein
MAIDHPRDHFGWMLNSESLFYELEKTHRFAVHYLYPKNSNYTSRPNLMRYDLAISKVSWGKQTWTLFISRCGTGISARFEKN